MNVHARRRTTPRSPVANYVLLCGAATLVIGLVVLFAVLFVM